MSKQSGLWFQFEYVKWMWLFKLGFQIQVEKAFVPLFNNFAAFMEDKVKLAAEVPTAAADDDSFMKSIREEHELVGFIAYQNESGVVI